MNDMILIKLGEIVLKGLNKRSFEQKLMTNAARRIRPYGEFRVYTLQSTVYVEPKSCGCDLDGAFEALKNVFGTADLAPYAIRWILMYPEVSVVIPGASKASQVASNVKAAELPELTSEQMKAVAAVYDRCLRQSIHPQW